MIRIQSLSTFYGNIQALRGVSLHVDDGEIVTLLGANGAGKTSLLNTICGLVNSRSGTVNFGEKDITNTSPEKIVKLGISQVPEGRQLFSELSVKENLIMGAYQHYRKRKKEVYNHLEQIFHIFPILKERQEQQAGTLSGGEQQMLAIGRALMSRPKLLLLDEPSMGLAPKIVSEIFKIITDLREQQKTTILLVEQNAHVALKVADRGYILETGRIVLQGSSEELLENKEIKRAYLGRGYKEVWE
ncbi:ATP-binding cassette domain-containing protein [Candidatus Poribacteria bacterium]|nr:ATP-binding cassette domain-containing protein [Candidatus Poribacteria bacterium]